MHVPLLSCMEGYRSKQYTDNGDRLWSRKSSNLTSVTGWRRQHRCQVDAAPGMDERARSSCALRVEEIRVCSVCCSLLTGMQASRGSFVDAEQRTYFTSGTRTFMFRLSCCCKRGEDKALCRDSTVRFFYKINKYGILTAAIF
jgi:hypothetical protein